MLQNFLCCSAYWNVVHVACYIQSKFSDFSIDSNTNVSQDGAGNIFSKAQRIFYKVIRPELHYTLLISLKNILSFIQHYFKW